MSKGEFFKTIGRAFLASGELTTLLNLRYLCKRVAKIVNQLIVEHIRTPVIGKRTFISLTRCMHCGRTTSDLKMFVNTTTMDALVFCRASMLCRLSALIGWYRCERLWGPTIHLPIMDTPASFRVKRSNGELEDRWIIRRSHAVWQGNDVLKIEMVSFIDADDTEDTSASSEDLDFDFSEQSDKQACLIKWVTLSDLRAWNNDRDNFGATIGPITLPAIHPWTLEGASLRRPIKEIKRYLRRLKVETITRYEPSGLPRAYTPR